MDTAGSTISLQDMQDPLVSLFKKWNPCRGMATHDPLKRFSLFLFTVVIALGIAAYGMVYLKHWFHARDIEKRIDRYSENIQRHAQSNEIPPGLVRAIIREESQGDPLAVSHKNARGLMQVRAAAEDDVLRSLDAPKGDIFDPDYNILIGTTYLRRLIDRFDGDLHLAVAAYHAGPANIEAIRSANKGRPGQELVQEYALPVTRAYCRAVLRDQPSRPPVTGSPAAQQMP